MGKYGAPADFSRPGTVTQLLQTYLELQSHEIVGCSEAEVEEVERVAGRPLPASYKQMLREMGRQVGPELHDDTFWRADMLYPQVIEIRELAADVIRHANADVAVLDHSFPFYNWEVYDIRLLDLSEPLDDPPVLELSEITGRTRRQYERFSQFLALQIMSAVGARKLRLHNEQDQLKREAEERIREEERRAQEAAEAQDMRSRARGAVDVWWRPSS
jgi:hypothetical protein